MRRLLPGWVGWPQLDVPLLVGLLLLMGFGLVVLYSASGGDLDTVMDGSGVPQPLSTSFQARAPLPETAKNIQVGMRGRAKIYTGWQPLGRRLYRFAARTFHFEL